MPSTKKNLTNIIIAGFRMPPLLPYILNHFTSVVYLIGLNVTWYSNGKKKSLPLSTTKAPPTKFR